MPRFEMMLFAQSVTVDREKNTLSIFHIIDGFGVPAGTPELAKGQVLPVGPPVVVITFWRRAKMSVPESASGRMRLIGPKGRRQFGSSEFKVELGGDSRRSQAMLNIPFIPYVGPGEYEIVIDIKVRKDKWKRVGSREFIVSKPT